MNARFVVSLAGLEHRELQRCERFAAELDRRDVPLSLLLAPRAMGPRSPHSTSTVVGWVRERASGGDAVAMHGFGDDETSRPSTTHLAARAVNGIRRDEASTLPAHEASLRLIAAVAAFEHIGMRPDTFAAPRRPVSAGTLEALHRSGFAVCADVNGVRELATGRVHSARVHALGRARGESRWYRRAVAGIGRAARSASVVQLAVDAADLDSRERVAALLDAVDLALQQDVRAVTYQGLVDAPTSRTGAVPRPGHGTNLDPLTS